MWEIWLEVALGYLDLSPNEFWELTPIEWCIKLEGWTRYQKDLNRLHRVNAWYSGYYSQVNLKQASLKQCIEDLMDPEELQKHRNEQMEEGAKLWALVKTSEKQR